MGKHDLPEGFKMTDLGPLPEEWEAVRLGEVVEESFSGGTPSTNVPSYWDGEIPWTTSAVIAEDDVLLSRYQKTISREGLENSSSKVAPRGSLIVGTRVGVGKAVVTTLDIAMSQDLTALILNRKVEGLFLAYSFKAGYLQKRIQDRTRGTTIKGIPRRDLLGVVVILPPLPEQRAIAQVLRAVQRAKEATEKVIAATRELKKSLMRHLFTYGPVPLDQVDQVPLKETEIGPLPEEWKVVRLGEVATVRGGVGFPHKYQGGAQGEYPFIKVSDMNLPGNETHIVRANHYVNRDVQMALKAKPFPPGTTVFPKVGAALHTNKKRLLTCPTIIDNNMMGVVPTLPGRSTPEFLFRWFENTNISDFSNPGPLPSINATTVKAAKLPLPSLPEQRAIAEILRTVDRKLEAEERRKAALDSLFKTLLHHLMTGKVRVGEVA